MADPRTQVVFAAEGKIEILLREENGSIRSIAVHLNGAPWAPEALADPEVLTALDEWAFSNVLPDAVDTHFLQGVFARCNVSQERLAVDHPPRA